MNLPLELRLERSWTRLGLIGLTLAMIVFIGVFIGMGYLRFLTLLVFGGVALVILWQWPLVGVFVLLLFSTQNLMFVSMDNLPYWQVAAGLRINMSDALLAPLFAVSVLKLVHRRERPLFLTPMVFLAVLITVALGGGILLGITNLDVGLGAARPVFAYAFYFVLVATMDTPRRVRAVVGMVFGIALVAVAVQIVEAAIGRRLTLGLVSHRYYVETIYINVLGRAVPYLWNRATEYLLVTLFLSLGSVFEGQQPSLYWPLAIAALTGFGISLVRQWYIYIVVGACAVFVLQILAGRLLAVLRNMMAIGSLLIIVLLLVPTFASLTIWAGRVQSISLQEVSVVGRIDILKVQLEYFRRSPLFGHGFSPTYLQLYSSDTGFANTLLLFGVVGLVAVVTLAVTVFLRSYTQWKQMPASIERGFMLGVVGLWVASVTGYVFLMDLFTRAKGIWMVVLVMAIVDRLSVQHADISTGQV